MDGERERKRGKKREGKGEREEERGEERGEREIENERSLDKREGVRNRDRENFRPIVPYSGHTTIIPHLE